MNEKELLDLLATERDRFGKLETEMKAKVSLLKQQLRDTAAVADHFKKDFEVMKDMCLAEREAETRRAEAYREGWARCLCEYDQKVTGGVMQSGKYHEAVDAQALQILNEGKDK